MQIADNLNLHFCDFFEFFINNYTQLRIIQEIRQSNFKEKV